MSALYWINVTVHVLAALYHHFDSKEAMLGEMLVGISNPLLDRGRALQVRGGQERPAALLPEVAPIFEEYVAAAGISDRLSFTPGNFFEDELPHSDVVLMGHILHDWDLDTKRMLIEKAYRTSMSRRVTPFNCST